MVRALQQFFRANAIVRAAQIDLQFMWWLWMEAVGARNRKRRRKRIWTRGWILERPRFGLYENLLRDLERIIQGPTGISPDMFQSYPNLSCN